MLGDISWVPDGLGSKSRSNQTRCAGTAGRGLFRLRRRPLLTTVVSLNASLHDNNEVTRVYLPLVVLLHVLLHKMVVAFEDFITFLDR